jgi:hypothetical protein
MREMGGGGRLWYCDAKSLEAEARKVCQNKYQEFSLAYSLLLNLPHFIVHGPGE